MISCVTFTMLCILTSDRILSWEWLASIVFILLAHKVINQLMLNWVIERIVKNFFFSWILSFMMMSFGSCFRELFFFGSNLLIVISNKILILKKHIWLLCSRIVFTLHLIRIWSVKVSLLVSCRSLTWNEWWAYNTWGYRHCTNRIVHDHRRLQRRSTLSSV